MLLAKIMLFFVFICAVFSTGSYTSEKKNGVAIMSLILSILYGLAWYSLLGR